ncbi:MAG: DUF92 domain-containing protein [Thermoanaerobaculia bacterium]|nr:DUF92 domain-containing protein [Thermoanaerobaculia bacterium]
MEQAETPGRSGRLTARELARKVVHMGVGLIAFAVVFLGPAYSALCAVGAVLMNVFLLPRAGGKFLWREHEEKRGASMGIVLYPTAVLFLILAFWNHLEVVAAIWAILAFGDGMASLVGMTVGGARLPWNPKKSWSGTFAYWCFGTAGAATLLAWTLHHQGESYCLGYLIFAAAVTALVGAVIESQPIGLDDNISVPLLAALVLHGVLMAEPAFTQELLVERWLPAILVGVGINLVLAVPAYLARSVSVSGAIAGLFIGTVVWASLGWRGWAVLVAFFVIGTGATKLGYRRKAEQNLAQEGGGRRGAGHAFANTGVPMMAAFFAATTPAEPLYLAAFVAAFATATGDTMGSEIGQLWGRRTFLVTTLKPVPRGTEGAVSLEGTLAGLFGSAFIACFGWVLGFYGPAVAGLVTLAAFLGTTLESFLGATVEKAGLLDNESVNFLNTLIGALLAAGFVAVL